MAVLHTVSQHSRFSTGSFAAQRQTVIIDLKHPSISVFDTVVAIYSIDFYPNTGRGKPYLYIIEALKDDDLETTKLPFPNKRGKIKLNDIAWVLDNIEALVDDYHKIL